jgi:3-carboxy-cis,cis-muconate cycloisomerase
MYRDKDVESIFSIETTYLTWVKVEIALAKAHCTLGIISPRALEAIEDLTQQDLPDMQEFSRSVINVGYPIIDLLGQMNAHLPREHRGVLHVGATTQDIMDTALALQISKAGALLLTHVKELGSALTALTSKHRNTLMPGRTHAQQAVPTTFGLKCAVYLSELTRHYQRILRAIDEASCLSLYGAAGTSAAMEGNHNKIRAIVSESLGLRNQLIPWHASRDRLIEVTSQCANLSVSLVRLAREIIDLSRSEIDEVFEPGGHLKGASSTMPQKRNPVMSEAIIGLGLQAIGQAHMMFRAGEVGHERAAGEWQLEWKALPEVLINTATATKISVNLMYGLNIKAEKMRSNLGIQYGTIMAEAYMIGLVDKIGREQAHDLVHEASKKSTLETISLTDALLAISPSVATHFESWPIDPVTYVGNSAEICGAAIQQWGDAIKIKR